ncbi:MAG: D-glycero-beta-D-manno-heptose-7-phosphate kinase [Candidatus Eremiobacteraeota bacterium]|nr:D-glycero-beta-D-manno-heptose-7-phosphate kinase [Candidatus Eremiobacteraeota bacterium]MBC5804089.1 D-glycero-beta-D-manno-heptose-7-phosphate kinase [Candidatus Eremiobacteraeota bacterium]MBC5821993.1 D-glycero-beta-D-manno-heptose-7-phosphate kinase [Candidatus Eremiobacteraeota bacterium]
MRDALALGGARELFARMRGKRVLVVGDVMLDEWVWGAVSRISPEAPVPVVAVHDHSFTLGGAGNVASNLCAIGVQVSFAGAVGNDAEGRRVLGLFDAQGVECSAVIALDDRPTTRKTRIVAHNQQVVRADWESTKPLAPSDRARMCALVARLAGDADAVILSDYAKGLFSRDLVEAAGSAVVVTADPKPKNIELFAGVTCVAPNAVETAEATGIAVDDDASLDRAGDALLKSLHCRYVVVTRGERGMAFFGAAGERLHIPSVARTVFDVSGAGDTVIAVLTAALAAGADAALAVQLANFAAGAVVEKLGTATASPQEILDLVAPDA